MQMGNRKKKKNVVSAVHGSRKRKSRKAARSGKRLVSRSWSPGQSEDDTGDSFALGQARRVLCLPVRRKLW